MALTDEKLTAEHMFREVAEARMLVRVPEMNELFVDIDSEDAYQLFLAQLASMKLHLPELRFKESSSKSGHPNRHVVVTLPMPVRDEKERVFLQALLGSDVRREIRSWLSLVKGLNTMPTVFFEKAPDREWRRTENDDDS